MADLMTRRLGPLLVVALALAALGLRLSESARADTLLAGQARARDTLAALQAACLELTRSGRVRADLEHAAPAAVQGLRVLPESGPEVAYVTDEDYVYALTEETRRESGSDHVVQGWLMRAWPANFGHTGTREYLLAEDGVLWEGQNRLGRSGTDQGFPPALPEPDLGLPRAGWHRTQLPIHR